MDALSLSLSPPALAVVGFILVLFAALVVLRSRKSFNAPFVGMEGGNINEIKAKYVHSADKLLREGYRKFRGQVFQLMTPDGPRLFLPRSFAEELKVYPRENMSGMKALSDRHLGHYTTIDHESDTWLGSIKVDLNQNLGKFVTDVEDEVDFAFRAQFPPCEDWTPIDLQEKLLRIVAQASARIFVGPALCRNDEWLNCSTKFATDVMEGAEKLKRWRPIMRPVAQFLVSEVRRIRGDHNQAYELLHPVLQARAQAERKEGYQKPNDMLQWIQDRAKAKGDKSVDLREQANLQLLTATAAIHTTRLAILHAILDLAARPEYINPLREEIIEVLAKSGGVLTKQCLTGLRMLDSFMKESQRMNPPSVATFQRKAMIPVRLSNGLQIPVGTIVQCNTAVLEEAPSSWGDPTQFDGFRFYRLRSKSGDAHKYQFASPTLESMEFGYGKDACPGRFFASNQIKIILAYIIRNYDITLEDKVGGRPRNIMFEVNVLADPTKKVLFKRIA